MLDSSVVKVDKLVGRAGGTRLPDVCVDVLLVELLVELVVDVVEVVDVDGVTVTVGWTVTVTVATRAPISS